jgi:hypothetical protein
MRVEAGQLGASACAELALMGGAGALCHLTQVLALALGGAGLQAGLRRARKLCDRLPIKRLCTSEADTYDAQKGDAAEGENRCEAADRPKKGKHFELFR